LIEIEINNKLFFHFICLFGDGDFDHWRIQQKLAGLPHAEFLKPDRLGIRSNPMGQTGTGRNRQDERLELINNARQIPEFKRGFSVTSREQITSIKRKEN